MKNDFILYLNFVPPHQIHSQQGIFIGGYLAKARFVLIICPYPNMSTCWSKILDFSYNLDCRQECRTTNQNETTTIYMYLTHISKGSTQGWTGDISICSRMLYHWAILPYKYDLFYLLYEKLYNPTGYIKMSLLLSRKFLFPCTSLRPKNLTKNELLFILYIEAFVVFTSGFL